jgi:PIN domain nuclease of toxin-antitoxin system
VSYHLDTHVAVWLVAGERRRLKPVERELRKGPLFVSPMAVLELQQLHELGRLRAPAEQVLDILSEDHGVEEAPGDFRDIALRARALSWTRDPFDRLIVAHALDHGSTLLTIDETIRANCPAARWG